MYLIIKKIGIILFFIIAGVGCYFSFREFPLAFVAIVGIVIFFAIAKTPKTTSSKNEEAKPISIEEILDYETMEDEYEEV